MNEMEILTKKSKQYPTDNGAPTVKVVIEIPRGSFLKKGTNGKLDFVSPLPCPFNYGSIHDYIGGEGDLLDAVVLGPRIKEGSNIVVLAQGSVGLFERYMYDDKLICSATPIKPWQRGGILLFFHFYSFCKGLLNLARGRRGRCYCSGWGSAKEAISRSIPNHGQWRGPSVPY